ncbi:MAG: diguanylate cyclase [Methylococcaceae bacterium]|nr:diguanylate cyclase [Methylococcaceae bacterium]
MPQPFIGRRHPGRSSTHSGAADRLEARTPQQRTGGDRHGGILAGLLASDSGAAAAASIAECRRRIALPGRRDDRRGAGKPMEGRNRGGAMNHRPPTILIVDDVPDNIRLLAEALKQENFLIRFALSGMEALELAHDGQPDLILLDVMMPRMDGYEVCTRLKADPVTEDIPVVFITASSDEQSELRGLQLGAADYVTKPISLPIVKARVRNLINARRSREQLRLAAAVFDSALEGIAITDAEGIIQEVNDAFCRITGYSREEAVGQTPRILKSGHHDPDFYQVFWRSLISHGNWQGEIWNRTKTGEIWPQLLNITLLRDSQGKPREYVAIWTDIRILKAHQQSLERMAYHDALTGLPNRNLLTDRLRQDIARTLRRENLLAVCFLDLDRFKPINDRYGHEVGDRVLREVAERLGHLLRSGDTVARVGGDEFILLLTDLSCREEAEHIAERALGELGHPLLIDGNDLTVGASIGIAYCPDQGRDGEHLIDLADQAMYRAKQSGGNRFLNHPGMTLNDAAGADG